MHFVVFTRLGTAARRGRAPQLGAWASPTGRGRVSSHAQRGRFIPGVGPDTRFARGREGAALRAAFAGSLRSGLAAALSASAFGARCSPGNKACTRLRAF